MATMGNWIKGRVMINDVSLIGENQTTNTATATTRLHTQSINHHGPSQTGYHLTQSQNLTASHHHPPMSNYYPATYSSPLLVSQFTEEEQVQIAKRIGLIQHLPTGTWDGGGESKNTRECVICMIEFCKGDSIRFLPCLHTYHVSCIDDWLMRSFICPSCMEPVDVALLSIF